MDGGLLNRRINGIPAIGRSACSQERSGRSARGLHRHGEATQEGVPLKRGQTMTSEMSNSTSPPARPLFRRLAAVLAVLCFLLTGLFGWFLEDGKWFFVVLCLFVGLMMTTIASTGYWPPRKLRGSST